MMYRIYSNWGTLSNRAPPFVFWPGKYRIRSNYGTCSNYGTPLFVASEYVNLFGQTYIVKTGVELTLAR